MPQPPIPQAWRYCVAFWAADSRTDTEVWSTPSDVIPHEGDFHAPSAIAPLPIGPEWCVQRRVYRTQNLYDSAGVLVPGREERFYHHSFLPGNTETSFHDTLRDDYLGCLGDYQPEEKD